MEKDKGYEFLFGDNKKSGSFRCEDGSEGYIYSDGSGYYRGADGSKGCIYSDGSGYFRGSDGSDGYKYSDGSGYFRGGSKKVDAYQYSDGSGYYGDAKHARSHYWPAEKPDNGSDVDSGSYSSSNEDSSIAELGGALLGAGILSLLAREQEEERQRLEEKKRRRKKYRNKCKAFCRRHWKGILIFILCAVLSVVVAAGIWQFRKMIPINYDSESLLGMNYEQVIMLLNEDGFTNDYAECTEDLDYEHIAKENQVYQVYIFGKNSFASTDKYPYDTEIIIKYHGVKLVSAPRSSKEIKGENYEDIIAEFKAAGFVNIRTIVKYDIITGWLTDDGEVESVTINGEKKYTEYEVFRPDAEIIVTYHTLRANKGR